MIDAQTVGRGTRWGDLAAGCGEWHQHDRGITPRLNHVLLAWAVCLDQAVKAVKAVQRMWYEEYTAKDRGDIVSEYADLLREHADLWVGRPAHIHLEIAADYGYPSPNLEEFLYQEAKQPSVTPDLDQGGEQEVVWRIDPLTEYRWGLHEVSTVRTLY